MMMERTQLFAAWRAQIATAGGMIRYEPRMRVGILVSLAFSVGLSIWSFPRLLASVQRWNERGTVYLSGALWLLFFATVSVLALLTALNTVFALRSTQQQVLLMLPVRPATLLRLMYGTQLLNLWNWMLIQVLTCDLALIFGLGWRGFPWLSLMLTGLLLAVWLGLSGGLLYSYVRLIKLLPLRKRLLLGLSALALLGLVGGLMVTWSSVVMLFSYLSPIIGAGIVLTLLLILFGPLAHEQGRWLFAALYTLQSLDRSPRAWTPPGLMLLQRLLAERRTLLAAFYTRALYHQGRNIFFWLRAALFLAGLGFALQVHAWIKPLSLSDERFVMLYAALLTLVPVLEVLPNAFAGEGSRFMLYLLLPVRPEVIIRARVAQFLLPLLTLGLLVTVLLAWLLRLSPLMWLYSLACVALTLSTSVCFSVLASIWDLNLQVQVEGIEQHIMQEEGPFSPRRILIFQGSLLVLGLQMGILWWLPPLPALVLLLVFALLLIPLLCLLSRSQMRTRLTS